MTVTKSNKPTKKVASTPMPKQATTYNISNELQRTRAAELVLVEGMSEVNAAWVVGLKESTLNKQIQVLWSLHSDSTPPNPSKRALAVAAHIAFIRANTIERVLFFPNEQCLHELFRLLESAERTMDIAVFVITFSEIVNVLIAASRRKPNPVAIRVICDKIQLSTVESRAHELHDAKIVVKRGINGSMHHKFCIIDDKMVLKGSINWSLAGIESNYEDLTIRQGGELPSQFITRYKHLYENRSVVWEPPPAVSETSVEVLFVNGKR